MTAKSVDKTKRSGGIGTEIKGGTGVPDELLGIGTRISDACGRLGRREDASDVMGVSLAALQRYIRGENMPPFEAVARLCKAADVSMEWIASGRGSMTDNPWQGAPGSASQPARPDRETLRLAADVLEKALASANASTDSAGRAELLVAIYELLEQGAAEGAAERVVSAMLRAASKAAGVRSKQG
ncbi:transcriptional regulator with XRE-family HTH domain [Dyella sp. SG562]|uniref:helix-turn-helix domain-containing protein n=1 Tax=Dyella sp. SG562 TaxID=2587017 RepID=UPI0014244766|nr:helix-turn-helix transcriptional regulator [Dyella sp. SG562]NII74248.1 transcriptional regulator with XRE-family HTH domain [Dyella sp. SG562]